MPRLFPANSGYYRRCVGLFTVLLFGLSSTAVLTNATATVPGAGFSSGDYRTKAPHRDEAAAPRPSHVYGHLPLSFETNLGQTDQRVKFLSRGARYSIFLTQTEAVLVVAGAETTSLPLTHNSERLPLHQMPCRAATVNSYALNMRFVGANPNARAEGLNALPAKSTYLIGNDPKKWRSGISSYGKVRMTNLYTGVDVVYYGRQGELEYDFVVAPGADTDVMTIAFDGAESLRIDDNGDLILSTPAGEIRHHKPSAYQEFGSTKRPVPARYVMKGNCQLGIGLGAYDRDNEVVIDPVLSYSTFLGGNGDDEGRSIAVDSFGNAYVTGWTKSPNFPKTAGAYQETRGMYANAFVSKLNPDGSALIYSTYLGGNGGDEGHGITVSAAGEAYITGSTASSDFPITPGAFQKTYGGSGDAFVAKLNASGTGLVYSTYVGGPGAEYPSTIAIDSQGNAHITGMVTRGGFPVTAGAFQTTFRGGYEDPLEWGDAYVGKLNADGSGLIYATYLGGAGGEVGTGIAVDREGFAYVTGSTDSKDFPVTPGVFQTNLANVFCPSRFANCANAFVTKFNLTGTALIYSTYVGGNAGEYGGGIAVDSSGKAFIAGSTFSSNFPTVNAFQTSFAGYRDAYITELNTTGTAAVFSSYLGGSGLDDAEGIALDPAGNIFIVGYSGSANLPVIDAIQPTLNGSSYNAFVAKLDPRNGTVLYCTYLGGSRGEGLLYAGIAVDAAGSAYVTGITRSSDFPTTVVAFQKTFGGGDFVGTPYSDAFVAKITGGKSGSVSYDQCLQDDTTGNFLQINTISGDYEFTSCDGFAISGTGTVKNKAAKIILQDNTTDRSVYARIKTAANKGTASIETVSPARSFTIQDSNTADNTCRCQ